MKKKILYLTQAENFFLRVRALLHQLSDTRQKTEHPPRKADAPFV